MGLHPALVSPGWHRMTKPGPFCVLMCSICGKRVNAETSKTDEDGQGVHAECYAQKHAGQQKRIDESCGIISIEKDHSKVAEFAHEPNELLEVKTRSSHMDDISIAGRTEQFRREIELIQQDERLYRNSRCHSLAEIAEHDKREFRVLVIREELRTLVDPNDSTIAFSNTSGKSLTYV